MERLYRNPAFVAVGAIWFCTGMVEFLLMGYFIGFHGDVPIRVYVSYFFSLGYLLNGRFGMEWVGGMPLSDWRWLAGTGVMFMISVVPWSLRNKSLRMIYYICTIVLFTFAAWAILIDMMKAIT